MTAHILRPLAVAHQAAATAARLGTTVQKAFEDPSEIVQPGQDFTLFVKECVDQMTDLTRYSLTAAEDAADCVARLNAESLRRLRATWLDNSRLPDEIKDSVKRAPIEPGVVPPERGVEFTAPVAGECLKKEHNQMFARVKAQKLLQKQSTTFKKGAPPKRKAQSGGLAPWKRGRQDSQPARSNDRPGQQFQRGRGGQRGQRGGRGGRRGTPSNQQKNPQGKPPPAGQGGKSS